MSLSIKDEEWLTDLLESATEYWDRLSAWEKGFVEDLQKRYEEEGSEMLLSSRMRECLVRIEDKAP